MGLSCSCEWDGSGWYFYPAEKFSVFDGKRSTRCCSCDGRIAPGDEVGKFVRERGAKDEIEIRIHGEDAEISIAPWWMCETCAGLYFALEELGYCVTLGEDMRELAKEAGAIQIDRMKRSIDKARHD